MQFLAGHNSLIGSTGYSVTKRMSTAGDVDTLDIPLTDIGGLPMDPGAEGLYVVSLLNPSTLSNMTVTAYNFVTMNSTAAPSLLTSFSVAAGTTFNQEIEDHVIQGLFSGDGRKCRLAFLHGTTATANVTLFAQVRKI